MAHIQRIISDFWSKWSSSYYQTLVKYHRWRLKTRNAEPGDVILVLDRERPKGKFTLGRISTVQTDADNIVRKVTIKYKLPQSGLNHELVPSAYKYAERNVRNLALVVTAQECEEIEAINIDEVRARSRPEETEEYTRIDDEMMPQMIIFEMKKLKMMQKIQKVKFSKNLLMQHCRISQLESQISVLLCDWGGSCPAMFDVCCNLPYNIRAGEMMVHHLYTERGLWNEKERFVNLELSKDSMVMYVGANTKGRDGKILMDMFGCTNHTYEPVPAFSAVLSHV